MKRISRMVQKLVVASPQEALAEARKRRLAYGFTGRKIRVDPTKPRRIGMAISDLHSPRQDPATWSIFLQAVRDIKPDFLWLVGDILDFIFANAHEKMPEDDGWTALTEFMEGNLRMDELGEAIGGRVMSELDFFDGNHCHRWKRMKGRGQIPPEMADVFQSVDDELWLKRRGWRYLSPEKQPHRAFPRFWVHHGHWYGENHARQHQLRLGVSSMYGHTHRPQVIYGHGAEGPLQTVALPCARVPLAEWRHPPTQPFNGWSTGFAVGEVVQNYPWWNLVLVHNNEACYGGIRWRAK